MESLKLTFTMSLEDWLAFQNHYMKTSPRYRDTIFVWQWFFAILLGAIGAYVFEGLRSESAAGGRSQLLNACATLPVETPRILL